MTVFALTPDSGWVGELMRMMLAAVAAALLFSLDALYVVFRRRARRDPREAVREPHVVGRAGSGTEPRPADRPPLWD
jgi:hypothetical protein